MGTKRSKKIDYTPQLRSVGKKERSGMKHAKVDVKRASDSRDNFRKSDICESCGRHGGKYRQKLDLILCQDCLFDVQALIKDIEF